MPSDPSLVESVEVLHRFAEHVAAVSVPASHEDVPDTVYPESHVGWHVVPLASESVQLPTLPFEGAAEASHKACTHLFIRCVVTVARSISVSFSLKIMTSPM